MDNAKARVNTYNGTEYSKLTPDIYFLIQRFLSAGILQKTFQTLNEELEEKKILPKRIDWLGSRHDRSVEDMEQQYPYIHRDFLYFLCRQASLSLNPNNIETSILSFRPKSKNKNNILHNYNQFYNYVTHLHGAPIQELKVPFNIVNCIQGRQVAGPFTRHRIISPRFYKNLQIQRTTLGHLSAVYCLLFDHSGRYIITGADDLLIKLWSTYTGRLISVFRGASSEITDIAIDPENSLLAAGSIDRILRVWNLQNGAPIAVLTGHTGMITSVNFCPTACWDVRYLISTSTDGSIAFWTYNYDNFGKVEFRNTPVLYQEKIRPGQSQMICSSFSPGGTFLATGSADHHVRVYYMKGDEGPQRILETEAHTDRVDSIQWAHFGLKFLSGSKDGTAIIWWFERQQWKSIHLDMTNKLPNDTELSEHDGKKLKVTMVTWDRSDSWVVTAVSDWSLKVWDASTGELVKVLTGHKDEVYVLEAHPHDEDTILSAGHDGQLFVWDIKTGEIVARYLNNVEGQGHGAIYDVKWSPDGSLIAASDSYGYILTFGFGSGNPFYDQLPKELFFHTDYRPLVRDQNYWVLDEQTQVPPHLMPPPFLVDIDGNPYPPMLQRLVPGRENCKVDQLVPNIVIGTEGTQEVIQDIPRRLLEDSEDEDVRGNAGGSHRSQRIRQSTGDWQTDPHMEWKKNDLVPPLKPPILERAQEIRELTKEVEMKTYQKQLRQRPHMISTAIPSSSKAKDKKKSEPRKPKCKRKGYQPLTEEDYEKYDVVPLSDGDSGDSSGYSDWMEEEGLRESKKPSRPSRRSAYNCRKVDDDDDDDDDETDDDTTEDEEEVIERKTYSRIRENNSTAKVSKASTSRCNSVGKVNNSLTKSASAPKANHVNAACSTSGVSRGPKLKISEQYKLSEWLSETRPRKSPYYPQIQDDIVYFVQGHQLYVEAVRMKSVYDVNLKEMPWSTMQLRDHEFCRVVDIQYEIKPPRLCCLQLELMNDECRLTGKYLTIRYHDMPDVLDFFVLKQTYDVAISRSWNIGDKFRCMIDDNWWMGSILNKSPASEFFPESFFMCYQIEWTNGERERMSPWDMEPIDEQRLPEDEKAAIPVLDNELTAILYKSTPEDWPNCERNTACKAITKGITQVMELAIAEPFLVPVDINVYPSYALIVEYPIDLSTIKARFENNFYRRLAAAQFDIPYIATNAEKFNEKHSIIVKHAKILTELCLRIVQSGNNRIDIASIYHQLVDGYESPGTEESDDDDDDDATAATPSTSRTLRDLSGRAWTSADQWMTDARHILDVVWANDDAEPFRTPVDIAKYPTYQQIIRHPMDLGTVREKLSRRAYKTPVEFSSDMRLIFQNSRAFNTNRKSRIYTMTMNLSYVFESNVKRLLSNWRYFQRRVIFTRFPAKPLSSSSSSSSSSTSKSDAVSVRKVASPAEDSDSDNTPLDVLKSLTKSGTNTESDSASAGLKHPVNGRKNNPESDSEEGSKTEDEYKPPKTASFDEDDEEEESEPLRRKSGLRQRPKRNRAYAQSDDSSDDDTLASIRTRRKRQRIVEDSESDSDDGSGNGANGSRCFESVSSRGRVRKITEKAAAFLKKDKKLA
ncbi:bromodomain and WD repeat-containing protein 3 [Cylas formicarius]|uniref:bromodomain and WD repeat-containing protein 3 n=1 Tax=Cylas formicarius TaxID=197179 RepID=UPI00295877F6|nr:bromodomain and WD repeat-containing protein 3 [Cylas formicarius]